MQVRFLQRCPGTVGREFESHLGDQPNKIHLIIGELAERSIALSLNLSGGDEPSIRSNRMLSSILFFKRRATANLFG